MFTFIAASALYRAATVDALPLDFSTPLLTWTGVIAVVLGLLLWGLLIPRSSHLREIKILRESHAREIAAYLQQIEDKNTEIGVLRTTVTVGESTKQELLAQHRVALETAQGLSRAVDQVVRTGLERTQEVTP